MPSASAPARRRRCFIIPPYSSFELERSMSALVTRRLAAGNGTGGLYSCEPDLVSERVDDAFHCVSARVHHADVIVAIDVPVPWPQIVLRHDRLRQRAKFGVRIA